MEFKSGVKVELKWSLGQLVVSSTSVCWIVHGDTACKDIVVNRKQYSTKG